MKMKPGLRLISETEGTGESVSRGDLVLVRLNGWLNKGEQFQKDHEEEIELGKRQVIAGLEYSLEGMKVGGKRKVRIGPHLAYRSQGVEGVIPPEAALIYEIVVLTVEQGPRQSRETDSPAG